MEVLAAPARVGGADEVAQVVVGVRPRRRVRLEVLDEAPEGVVLHRARVAHADAIAIRSRARNLRRLAGRLVRNDGGQEAGGGVLVLVELHGSSMPIARRHYVRAIMDA